MDKFLLTVHYGEKEVDANTGDKIETLRFLSKYNVKVSEENIDKIKEQKTFKLSDEYPKNSKIILIRA